jgi:filamentous hemagglutinin family protein
MKKTAIALAVSALFVQPAVLHAAPEGGQVVAGQASIRQQGKATQIDQTTRRSIINWKSFDIGSDEKVRHTMPDANSHGLHRVIGGKGASQLMGELSSNGNLYLVNPAGVVIHKGARIDAGGFVASTADIANENFMRGNLVFDKAGNPGASIINLGQITVRDLGFAALVAPVVRNDGIIAARLGKIALASNGTGEGFKLDLYGDDLIAFTTPEALVDTFFTPEGERLGVTNDGEIKAEGGVVLLTARQLDSVVQSVIHNGGTVSAASATLEGGTIVFRGEGQVEVKVSGELDASGETGGQVAIDGERVELANARIDASGENGGGTILMGNAQTPELTLGANVALDASTEQGKGGFIETSGARLEMAGNVKIDAGSRSGQAGQWLIDPADLTVDVVAAQSISDALGGGTNVALQTTADGASGPGRQDGAGNGDIFIDSPINWDADSTLTLDAYHSVEVNAPITAVGANAGLTVYYDRGGSEGIEANFYANAPVNLPVGGRLEINGESFTLIDGLADMTNLDGRYALRKDIDSDISAPIGSWSNVFYGTLEGLGHAVNGLTMDMETQKDLVGLFVVVGGTVRNLGLVGGSVKGSDNVGMLASYNSGSIINSYATGDVSGDGWVGGVL